MNFFHKLFFKYLKKFQSKIYPETQNWDTSDLPKLENFINIENIFYIIHSLKIENKKVFIKQIIYTFRYQIFLITFLMLIRVLSGIAPILSIYFFIENLTNMKSIWLMIFSALILPISVCLNGFMISHYFFQSFKFKITLKFIFLNLIFEKIKMKKTKGMDEGKLLNHLSHDCESISLYSFALFEFAHDILVIFCSTIILFSLLEIATLPTLFILILLIPITKIISRKISHNEGNIYSYHDKRIRNISSIFIHMRNLKSLYLEKYISKNIADLRNKEIFFSKKKIKYLTIISLIYAASQSLICGTAFGSYVLLGNILTLPLVFSCLTIFKFIESPIGDASEYIAQFSSSTVSFKRVFEYLSEPEINKKIFQITPSDKIFLNINSICSLKLNLYIENLKFIEGESIAIIGAIGSGKSLFLNIFANNIEIDRGQIHLSAKPLMLEQIPWIIDGTIRENILLSNESEDISEILNLTCLDKDIDGFELKEDTEIGENGIKLSGGQKQRLALARAIAANSNILILDDPFSALDKDTEDSIFKNLLFGKWKDKIRIIATHNLKNIYLFDKIILIKNKKIAAMGSFQELFSYSDEFKAFYEETNFNTDSSSNFKLQQPEAEPIPSIEEETLIVTNEKEKQKINKIIQKYIMYLKLLSNNLSFISIFLIFITIMAAFLPRLQDFWIGLWSSGNIQIFHLKIANNFSQNTNIIIFIFLGFLSAISIMIQCFLFLTFGIFASMKIHNTAFNDTIKASLPFFDNHSSGKLINIFSYDISQIDNNLPDSFRKFILVVFEIIFIFSAVLFVQPWAIFIIIPIYLMQRKVQIIYINSTREFNLKIALPKSKLLSYFRESIKGNQILVNLNKWDWYSKRYINSLIQIIHIEFTGSASQWWQCIMEHLNISILLLFISCGGAFLVFYGYVHPAIIAILTTWILSDALYFMFRIAESFGKVEAGMISMDRIQNLILNDIKSYPKEELISKNIKKINTSDQIHIQFKSVSFQYNLNDKYVFKNLSFDVKKREFIGIKGKTGSGKSTILQLLLRFYVVKQGEITLNGDNINDIPLSKLRESFALVLQNPILFPGTILQNLDPYNSWEQNNIKLLLEELRILHVIENLPNAFETSNWECEKVLSEGQKQIICFARAIINPSPILLLDEATANIDIHSQKTIMNKILELKGKRTIIMIAHRSEMFKFTDRILSF